MKKAVPVFFLFFIQILSYDLSAQVTGKIAYSDTFVQGTNYCPSSSQYAGWGTFRAKLDTSNYKILSVTMKGTYDATGRTCSDSFIARKLAARLKNPLTGSDLTISCGGNTWVVSELGSCISGGSCANTSDNVGIAADGATHACNCYTPSYQMRPIIGNGNWGGINTSSCPGSSQRMTLEFTYRLYPIDASVSTIYPPDLCSNPNQLTVTIKNAGSKTLDSVWINWSLNGNLQTTTYLKKKLLMTKDTTLTIKTGLYYTPYTTYTLKVWTSKPNGTTDNYSSNDTLKYIFTYTGTPKVPDARDTAICGSGIQLLTGKPSNPGDTLIWYNSNTGNTILGVGRFFKTSFLSPGNYKYFLGSAGKLVSNSLQTNFNGGNQQAGFMLNIAALQNSSIDSMAINIGATVGSLANIEVYYRDGGYVGYETNASAWTTLGKYTVTSKGTGIPTSIPTKISIPIGKTYGFYIQTTNAPSFYLQYGNLVSSVTADATMQITTGVGVALNWGTTFTGRNGNIRLYYKIPSCISLRDSMVLTVKGKPTGAASIKGSPFNSPNSASTGTKLNPDIASFGKELNYELQPPKGYNNLGFGTTWIVTDVRVLISGGKSVPDGDTALKLPTPTSNGKMRFIPSASLEDSIVTIYTTVKDLITSRCDSLIERSIYIAPTPKTNFSFTNVCFGTPIEFKNLTTLRSGFVNYKWDFGNGDTSNFSDPVYNYPAFGSYNVKLTAKTNFGIIKDTVIKVTVYEIPDIKFKIINACMGDSLSSINYTTISSGTINYKWDLGDGKTSNKVSLKYRYINTGSYIVTLTATANGCTNSLSKKAYQFAKPIADFSVSGACSKNEIVFSNKTTIGLEDRFGSSWLFGDGSGNNDYNPTHIYLSAGTKTVKYIATSQFGCTDSISKIIVILASPEAAFTNGPVCNVKPVIFNNSSVEPSGISTGFLWDFGDGNTSFSKNPQHNFSDLGKKIITLVASGSNGCSTIIQKEITVLQQPIVNFEALDACIGSNIIFTNKTIGGGLINYKWNFGDGDSSVLFSPIKKYGGSTASTYNVTLKAKNIGGCEDIITLPVNIREAPSCGFTFKSAGTGGFEFIFTPNVMSYPFYQWSFEGGGSSNAASPKHKFQADGKYRVRAFMKTVDGCECLDTSQFVLVNHVGVSNFNMEKSFKIFPNPNTGSFTIELDNPEKDFAIEVYDVMGKFVLKVERVEKVNLIDLHAASGIYLVKVKNGGAAWMKKVSVVR
jgi:PKD repeat protein